MSINTKNIYNQPNSLDSVSQNVIPIDDTYNLGSASTKWNEIYANTIFYDTLNPQPIISIPEPFISNIITSRQSFTGNIIIGNAISANIITANSISSEYINGSLIEVINNTYNLVNYLSGSFQLNLTSPYSNNYIQKFKPIENYCYLKQLQIKLRNDSFGTIGVNVIIRNSQNQTLSVKSLGVISVETIYTLTYNPNEIPLNKNEEYQIQVLRTNGIGNLVVYFSNSPYFLNSFFPLGGFSTSAFSVNITTDKKIVANTINTTNLSVGDAVINGSVIVSNDVSVSGNLTVLGNQIIASVQSVVVEDNIMMLNKPNLNVQGFNFDSGIAISYSGTTNPALIYKKIPQTNILNGRIDRFLLGNIDLTTANLDSNGNPFGGNAVFTDLSILHVGSLEGNLVSGNLNIGQETARINIGGNLAVNTINSSIGNTMISSINSNLYVSGSPLLTITALNNTLGWYYGGFNDGTFSQNGSITIPTGSYSIQRLAQQIQNQFNAIDNITANNWTVIVVGRQIWFQRQRGPYSFNGTIFSTIGMPTSFDTGGSTWLGNGWSYTWPNGYDRCNDCVEIATNPHRNINILNDTANGVVINSSGVNVLGNINVNNNDITSIRSLTTSMLIAENIRNFFYLPMNVIDTFPKIFCNSSNTATNGAVNITYFIPMMDMTISSMGHIIQTIGTDSGGTSVRRYGLYRPTTLNGNTLNLVARTAINNTIGTTQGYTAIPLATAGGFPATFTLQANNQYCLASIFYNIGGTFNGPAFMGCLNSALVSDVNHRSFYRIFTQTDLPSSITLTTTDRSSLGAFGRFQ